MVLKIAVALMLFGALRLGGALSGKQRSELISIF